MPNLAEVAIRHLIDQHDMSGGTAGVVVNPKGITLQGSTRFSAIPLSFNWSESFSRQSAWRRQVRMRAPQVEAAAISDFGLNLGDVVEGTFCASAEAVFTWNKAGEIKSQIDLKQSALTIPLLNWHKAVGDRATVEAVLHLNPDRPALLDNLVVEGEALALQDQAELDLQRPLQGSLELRDLM